MLAADSMNRFVPLFVSGPFRLAYNSVCPLPPFVLITGIDQLRDINNGPLLVLLSAAPRRLQKIAAMPTDPPKVTTTLGKVAHLIKLVSSKPRVAVEGE